MQFLKEPQSCPADIVAECTDSGEWEGEFFPEINKINYEVIIFRIHLS